jgi:hypothetical protein
MAFFLIIDILTFVAPSIWPVEDSLAFHLVVLPLSPVLTAIRPVVHAYMV